jgi:translation initiation factor 5
LVWGWQIEGRGNGIKTNVVNNVEIAKALERPPDCKLLVLSLLSISCKLCPSQYGILTDVLDCPPDIVKFYGCELGAQTKYDKKSGTSIVNGAHDTSKLSELLEVMVALRATIKLQSLSSPFSSPYNRVPFILSKDARCSLVQSFIKKYVQCYNCGNPETVVKIRKENIFLKCKACGHTSDVDMRHRLNTYILKNPPEEKLNKAEKKCA